MVKDQVELPSMFKKYEYDELKSLLETWLETGTTSDSEEEQNPNESTNLEVSDNTPLPGDEVQMQNPSVANVKDAFDDLFNN